MCDIDIVMELRRSLFESRSELRAFQALLIEKAPQWSRSVRNHWWAGRDTSVDFSDPDSLWVSLLQMGDETAPRRDAGREPRRLAFMELRGANRAFDVVVSADDAVLSSTGSAKIIGNDVAIQVRAASVDGQSAIRWSRQVFEIACSLLSAAYGHMHCMAEYEAKNIRRSEGTIAAVGVDRDRYLPGIYWHNYFDEEVIAAIGLDCDRIEGLEVERLDEGLFIRVAEDPAQWNSEEYQARVQQVVGACRAGVIFDRFGDNPGVPGLARMMGLE